MSSINHCCRWKTGIWECSIRGLLMIYGRHILFLVVWHLRDELVRCQGSTTNNFQGFWSVCFPKSLTQISPKLSFFGPFIKAFPGEGGLWRIETFYPLFQFRLVVNQMSDWICSNLSYFKMNQFILDSGRHGSAIWIHCLVLLAVVIE